MPTDGRRLELIEDDTSLSQKINETHLMTSKILEHMEHIPLLSASLASISVTLAEIKTGLIAAATGRDQVPVQVVQTLFKMWSLVIFALLIILVFLLTGKAFGWFNLIPG